MEHEPRLAVVVPTLNEAQNIHRCICSLLVQLPPTATIVVADGGSVDNTLSLIAEFCKLDSRVSIIHNRARIQSAAVNLVAGMLLDHADVLVRADAHAIYRPTFLASLIKAFRTSGAQSVVVPMRAVGKSLLQKAIAATQNSRLGNGGASHRGEARSGFVDH